VSAYHVRGICPEFKCTGKLIPSLASELRDDPYYKKQYASTKIIPMVAREHTAQLTKEAAGKYQRDFEEGRINVLSCSTTFEMGVDVGELEATFLRNVPPETANYIQRAGRAGRRTSSTAFSVTFARRNSHDINFFNHPAEIISGKIRPPYVEINNDKIVQQHVNSANGRIWTSRYINTVPDKNWPAFRYYECQSCKHISLLKEPAVVGVVEQEEGGNEKPCPICSQMMRAKKFMVPIFGFSTALEEEPAVIRNTKLQRGYSSRIHFWGIGELDTYQKEQRKEKELFTAGRRVKAGYSPNGQLVVLNRGHNGAGLWVCRSCGFMKEYPTKPEHKNKWHQEARAT